MWALLVALIGGGGLGGLLTRGIQVSRAHRLERAVKRLTALLADLPSGSAGANALLLARQADVAALAALSLVPAWPMWSATIRVAAAAGYFVPMSVIALSALGVLPRLSGVSDGALRSLWILLGLAGFSLWVGLAAHIDHRVQELRRRVVQHTLDHNGIDWSDVERILEGPTPTPMPRLKLKPTPRLRLRSTDSPRTP